MERVSLRKRVQKGISTVIDTFVKLLIKRKRIPNTFITIDLMAVLANNTAIKKLSGSNKSMNKTVWNASSSLSFAKKIIPVVGVIVITGMAFTNKVVVIKPVQKFTIIADPQDSFPVPAENPKQLFYLQRTSNTNTIVCELNLDSKGQLNKEMPVHVFWLRYAEGGMRKELNYLQRVFAYGINTKLQSDGTYNMHFVSYKKQNLLLMHSPKDNKYYVYATINQKQVLLNRVFLKVEGGTFWSPNIVYMEMKGTDPATGKELIERFKP